MLLAGIWMAALELKRVLQMFQQNSYRPDRYRRWSRQAGDSTSLPHMLVLVLWFAGMYLRQDWWWMAYPGVVLFCFYAWNMATTHYKKPLVMTRRAWRIYGVMTLLELIVFAINIFAIVSLSGWTLGDLAMGAFMSVCEVIILSTPILLLANWLLKPVEKRINRKYYNDAARILASMPDLKIIGITGSYGKTSTKHYLQRILSEHYDTLMTPGSFNTTMGVIRTVREHLKPYNEVFIIEMGAKQTGDIKEICDLVHPSMGIITAVGCQHLESFKTIENVQATKFELADALPADGLVVVNNDFEYVANRPVDNVECIRYGVDASTNPAVSVKDIEYDPTGTTFTVTGCGPDLRLHTRLVGECNVSNLIAAVIIARRLGVPDEKIQYAVSHIEQVEHRLNVKRTPGGLTIIDDAFNSNPTGSRMACDVLRTFKGGKRIIITPGMIELGDEQEDLNQELGRHIAESADVAIIVGQYNREALLSGIEETRPNDDNVHAVGTFAEAQQLLQSIARAGDTVLYENDLPDTFK